MRCILLCKSVNGNKLLRNIENSHHKDWPFENRGEQKKIKDEINSFLKFCIEKTASHDSEDSFGLTGTSLFTIGTSKSASMGKDAQEITEENTSGGNLLRKINFRIKSRRISDSEDLLLWIVRGGVKKSNPKSLSIKHQTREGKAQEQQESQEIQYYGFQSPNFQKRYAA